MRKLLLLTTTLFFFSFLLLSNYTQGQTIGWNFTAGTATPSTTAPTVATASDLVQGNNNGVTTFITAVSVSSGYAGASGTFNAGLAARVGVLNTAASGSPYVEFTLTPISGQSVTLNAISFGTRSTSTGVQAYTLRSSLDAYASDIATGTITNNSTWALKTNTGLSIASGIGTAITFRIYGYNGAGAPSAGTANWRLDDLILSVSGASTNADLSGLALSTGTLTPTFASATTTYTSSVANAITSITVTPTASNANATITVNGNAVTSGNPSGAIALNVGANIITTVVTAQDAVTTKTYTVSVTRAAAGTPTLTQTGALADFGNVCINTLAGPNSFAIDGTDLDGSNIAIAALAGFTYSETAGGMYNATLNFSYTGNSFTKIIYVQFNPLVIQSYNGNIVLSGGGVASFNVAATGAGVNNSTVVTTGGSSAITSTSATVAGTITTPGCSAVTAYGIEYSLTSGFVNGAGTQVPASNLNAGNFSVGLTGLTPNTRIYYKAYVTDGSGTVWGAQQAFNCLPLAVQMAIQPSLTFTEPFTDIANWSDFFITGTGANHWDGLSTNGTTPIPSAPILTTQTNTFQIPSAPGANVTSGGVQKGTDQIPTSLQSIVLLATGTTNNTTSAAIDFYVDFTGVNAGTLSFDYATINNGAGDRPGSLRVYVTVDGISYTEVTNVLNFTNNTPLSDSKSNIPLPALLNNNANARIRFYYYNGETGGTTGARPKLSIDNVKINSVANTPCVSPTAAATALTFGTITDVSIQASFTVASPASDGYVVVMSTANTLTAGPVNGQIYNIGDNLGDGTVIANGNTNNFTATGLSPLTTYYFFVFSVNSACTGGPLYFGTSLNGNATTIAGLPTCIAPAAQPTALILNLPAPTINTIQGSFTATTANEYLVLRTTAISLTNTPVNGQVYTAGDILGNAVVVQKSAATTFTASGLQPATAYNFFIFSLNGLPSCVNGPVYNITNPLTGTETTQPLPPCVAPSAQPTNITLTVANTSVSGTFSGVAGADAYIVVRSLSPTLGAVPADNTDYNAGDIFGSGVVVTNSNSTSFLATGLTANTAYYFFVFAANKNCSGGTKYATGGPLTGNITTLNAPANNFYFGTLHSHSDYSDGNTDNPGFTPAQDYAYAMTAQCMDYLGISEHNHFSAEALLSNYHLGVNQANAFTLSNPNFLALYGMEWGTISTGGHVLIYGDGMDNLWGWESGSGTWGSSNNYDVYVPKGVYTGNTGLFKITNDNIATNTFASLAHPGLGDFNNIDAIAYDAVADNAISAVAVESGPSTSANTTYSNPAFSMGYLWYYQTLLAKGYHLGPTIDHDNHRTTFGHTTYSRTAIVAPNLTKTAIVTALKNMNFYATQDCDSKVDFTINTKIMGSIITDRFAPNISVILTDATPPAGTAVIRVMHGVPGSGTLAVKIDSAIGTTLNFSDNNLANLATGYYYIDITFGTSRIVTAPIWYTRNDAAVLPIKLSSFTVQKINNTAKISWVTEQETNSSHFIVERSVDGRIWNTIATVAAAGNSSHLINYSIDDNAPMRGINYYRLKQVDKDAKYDYSVIQKALFNSIYTAHVAPNPSKDFINLYLAKVGNNNQQAIIQLLNAAGKIIYKTATIQSNLQINTTAFGKGLYFVKVIDADNVTTIKVVIQ